MQTPRSDRSVHLDAVRAIAALIVFTGHTRSFFLQFWRSAVGLGRQPLPSELLTVSSPSHEAVIVFFVLSGFLVGGAVLRSFRTDNWSWERYLTARITRLWVVLIPALVLTAILDAVGKAISPADSIYWQSDEARAGSSSALTFLGNIAFLQTILVRTFGSDGQLWSLANEFWYYILFPILMIVVLRRNALARLTAGVAMIAVLLFVGQSIAIYSVIWLMGLIPYLPRRNLSARYFRITLSVATAILVLSAIALVKLRLNLFLSDVILGFVFAIWCYAALHKAPGSSASFSIYAWAATHLSRMSYTLYLVHVPLLALLSGAIVGSWNPWPLDVSHLAAAAAIWLFVLAASYGFYLVFERNTDVIRQYCYRLIPGRTRP
jgi:peptidoglycan/LPS O-acetylase OafA/YrhL